MLLEILAIEMQKKNTQKLITVKSTLSQYYYY